MLGAAGGHQDYAGNEVNALQLNTETPKWAELRAATGNENIINAPAQFYKDYRPSSTHTYNATQFINSLNRMIVFASPGINGSTIFPAAATDFPYKGSSRSFSFNMNTNDWDSPDYIAQYTAGEDFTGCLCVKHPVTEDVYYSRNSKDSYNSATIGGWFKWSPTNNTWTRLSPVSRYPWYAGSAIDPKRNRMLIVGGYNAANPAEVRDLNGTQINVTFTGPSLQLGSYTGVIYDESLDKFLVFDNTNPIRVLRVDPVTWSVDIPTISGSAPTQRMNGINNSAQYVPELKGFVIANKHDGNVYFVRTAV